MTTRINNYKIVQGQIAEAAVRCSRKRNDITLVAVTKQVSWDDASDLYALGQRDFGENRLFDALEKRKQSPDDCHWHFIGTLQSNKVRKAIGHFSLIHSVDSLELARKISNCSTEEEIITPVLLQVNTSGEISKQGLSQEGWKSILEDVLSLEGISLEGLMTMAPLGASEREARTCFAALHKFREELQTASNGEALLKHLSMGMSHDFPWAIAEGATIVRIGTALFGEQ